MPPWAGPGSPLLAHMALNSLKASLSTLGRGRSAETSMTSIFPHPATKSPRDAHPAPVPSLSVLRGKFAGSISQRLEKYIVNSAGQKGQIPSSSQYVLYLAPKLLAFTASGKSIPGNLKSSSEGKFSHF